MKEYDIEKYIKDGWCCGKFIREEFAFTKYFKRGAHAYYYYKPTLIVLGKELKERNVNINRYMELRRSEADFQKRLGTIKPQKTTNKVNHTGYKIPAKAKNIIPTSSPLPSVENYSGGFQTIKSGIF